MAKPECLSLHADCTVDAGGEVCADCAAYAGTLATARGTGEARLPAGLRRRLLAIPQREEQRPDNERVYVAALERAVSGRRDDALEAQLARWPQKAAVYNALAATFEHARRPRTLPGRLRRRLVALAHRPALPVWLTDQRYAAAACLLLTAFLSLAAGDVLAHLERTQETVQTVRTTSSQWMARSEAKGAEISDRLARDLDLRLAGTHSTVSSWIGQGRGWVERRADDLSDRWNQSRLAEILAGDATQQGDDHER